MSTEHWRKNGGDLQAAAARLRAHAARIGEHLFAALLGDAALVAERWVVLLLRMHLDDPARTFTCDPGYEVNAHAGSLLLWIEPYTKPDWQMSQRYPEVVVLRHGA